MVIYIKYGDMRNEKLLFCKRPGQCEKDFFLVAHYQNLFNQCATDEAIDQNNTGSTECLKCNVTVCSD